jgi:hypothetical protein
MNLSACLSNVQFKYFCLGDLVIDNLVGAVSVGVVDTSIHRWDE